MASRRVIALAAVVPIALALPSTAAALTVAHPTHTREVATVKSDLKGLAVAEETYFTDHPGKYTTRMSKLRAEGYVASKHTTVRVIWVNGSTSYCLAGRYVHGGESTKRSYDSAAGGLKGSHFSCEAHKPRG